MAKTLGAITLVLITLKAANAATSLMCEQKSPCLCTFSEYSKIDLSELLLDKEKDPKKAEKIFLGDTDGNVTFYSHGCSDGSWSVKDHGAKYPNQTDVIKASFVRMDGDDVTIQLNSAQMKFHQASDNPEAYEISYTNGSDVFATIRLICDNFMQPFIKIDETNLAANKFILSSPHACIVTHHPGLSTGSILVIIFFVAIAIYLIAGALLAYFIRGARGLELIPNIDFWRGLPGLVRDGIIFLFSGCSPYAINTPDSYDKI